MSAPQNAKSGHGATTDPTLNIIVSAIRAQVADADRMVKSREFARRDAELRHLSPCNALHLAAAMVIALAPPDPNPPPEVLETDTPFELQADKGEPVAAKLCSGVKFIGRSDVAYVVANADKVAVDRDRADW